MRLSAPFCIRQSRRILYVPVLSGLALVSNAVVARSEDWTRWRGPDRNGISRETGWATRWPESGPPRLWQAKLGKSYSAVTVKGQRLYTMGNADGKDTVFCFDARTGETLWQYRYGHPKRESQADPNPTATSSTPVLDGGRVYTLSREGLALCLNAQTGKLLWQRELQKEKKAPLPPFGFASAPVIDGSRVLYNVGTHGMALDKTNGKTLWNSGGGLAGHATPVLHQMGKQRVAAIFNGSGLMGVDPATGRKLWSHPWKTQYNINAADPVLSEDRALIIAYDRAQQLQIRNGKVSVLAEPRTMRSTFNSPILLDGFLYGNGGGALKCVEWKTGKERWRQGGLGDGGVIVADGKLIALSERGELIVAAAVPDRYTEIARARVMEDHCWTHPVLANGLLYCRNNEGDLICLDLRPAP